MNISFENYEEYFLLYADNELSEAGKAAVNDFVAANPALKAELDVLMQTQCTPGDFSLPDNFKKTLYYPIDATSEKHSEELMLLVDGELDAAAEKQLTGYLNKNTEAQKEYHLLLATKNIADINIVFPDKQKLYKKGKAPVIAVNYFRLVAAACIITVISGAYFFLNRDSDEATTGPNQPIAAVPVQKTHDTGAHLPHTDISANNNSYPLEVAAGKNTTLSALRNEATGNNAHNSIVTSKNIPQASIPVPTPATAETNGAVVTNNIANNVAVTQHIDGTDKKNTLTAVPENALTNNLQNNATGAVTSVNPQPLHLTNRAGSEDITFVAEDNSNNKNTKLRGFFRKVTRAVERTTNIKTTNDEDELLIGSFAIKL